MLKIYAPKGKSVEICEIEGSASEVFAQIQQVLAGILDQTPDPGAALYVLLSTMGSLYNEQMVVDAVKYYMEEYIYYHEHNDESEEGE